MSEKIKCSEVRYRQGFIEVANVHAACVNLEIWNLHPDTHISGASELSSIPDAAVVGNTEIELNVEQARRLVERLEEAIARAEAGSRNAV